MSRWALNVLWEACKALLASLFELVGLNPRDQSVSGTYLVAEVHNFEHVPCPAGSLHHLAGLSIRHGFRSAALSTCVLSCRTPAWPSSPV